MLRVCDDNHENVENIMKLVCHYAIFNIFVIFVIFLVGVNLSTMPFSIFILRIIC